MEVKQLLIGHVSPETAYLVADYPYGFTLRCQIRYWLEFNKTHGVRLVSQTSNPKKAGLVWNKPKASTYCRFGGAMFLDENDHVQWSGLSEYTDAAEAEAWRAQYGAGVPADCVPLMNKWCEAKRKYEELRDAGKIQIFATSEKVKG
jgi:hypothetical protein